MAERRIQDSVTPARTRNLLRNPHFWILTAILVALTIVYTWDIVFHNQRWQWLYNLTIFEFRYSFHGSLYAIPIIYAAYIFWWKGALITWLLSMAVVIPRIFSYRGDSLSFFENILFLLIPLLLIIYFSLERNWRERERKALAVREAERQAYTQQVLKAQEDERRRIAQELHDDPTQTLLVIANRAQALVSDGLAAGWLEKQKELEWIRDTTVSVSENLKRICLDLRPSVLDDLGLVAALTWAVEEFNRLTQIRTTLELEGNEYKLSPEKEVTLFRIVQEALSNIRRHSRASRALVKVAFSPEKVTITVQDNGRGFPVEKKNPTVLASGKLGLLGMRERTQLLNGSFSIQSEPGQGTRISVEVRAQ